MSAKGIFIVFEGIDGAGKTTQVDLLAQNLASLGREVSLSAEPTTLATGKAIRRALSGEEKKSLTVENLLERFSKASDGGMLSDRAILS